MENRNPGSSFLLAVDTALMSLITTKPSEPVPRRFPATILQPASLVSLQLRGHVGPQWHCHLVIRESISLQAPPTKQRGLFPGLPPELTMLILHLEIKEAMFRRPPNARIVAAGNSSISDSPPIQAHNRYPLLVKCLCEPSEEEC